MGVLELSFKIVPIKKEDIFAINKIIKSEVKKDQTTNIKTHIRRGIAYKMIDEKSKNIAAFCLAYELDTHFSLSYYYVFEDYRRKLPSIFFFMFCLEKMKNKNIYVKKNKNYDQYKTYFTQINENILRFQGLKDNAKWADLLKVL